MYLCIATHIVSSLPDLFTTSWFPSHCGLCLFEITLFAPLQWACQPHYSFRFPSLSLFLPCPFSSLTCDPCPTILLHLFWSIIHICGRTCNFWPLSLDNFF
jgi:hypothetical protein